jgi:thiamine biosynthesis lipoprotein ApbE
MFDEPGLRYAHQSMRTTFDLFFPGPDTSKYQGIAEDCANEVTEIELAISPYQEGSDIQRLNVAAGSGEWIRIGWPTIKLLQLCHSLHAATLGSFAPFDGLRSMRLSGKVLDLVTEHLIQQTSVPVSNHEDPIEFHPDAPMARLSAARLIDLGAIGKGWALDKCAALALDVGIERAFFHAGGSSIIAIGDHWPVRISGLEEDIHLSNTSLSVSRRINPDAGGIHIVANSLSDDTYDVVARAVGVSCAITDALSTAAISGTVCNWKNLSGYETKSVVLFHP